MVSALQSISPSQPGKKIGTLVGIGGMVTAGLILSFYSIIAGWMLAYMLEPLTTTLGQGHISAWLTTDSVFRDVGFATIFIVLTVLIISAGVEQGIEKWSSRLMPSLFILMLGLIAYVFTQDGAMAGLYGKCYIFLRLPYFIIHIGISNTNKNISNIFYKSLTHHLPVCCQRHPSPRFDILEPCYLTRFWNLGRQ